MFIYAGDDDMHYGTGVETGVGIQWSIILPRKMFVTMFICSMTNSWESVRISLES